MGKKSLSQTDKSDLLKLARQSIEKIVKDNHILTINLEDYSSELRDPAATFVTITKRGELRGCIGTLEAYQPLVMDVIEHAAAAAVSDYRFRSVSREELSELEIEISVLTKPEPLLYSNPDELNKLITPHRDGVILKNGLQRATFLPQVWEKLPSLDDFLGYLCLKMGAKETFWKEKVLEVHTYQVIEFHE